MTIGYTTQWPKSMGPEYAGKPNHFVEKILQSVYRNYGEELNKFTSPAVEILGYEEESEFFNNILDSEPKLHTFRADPKDRWKVGMKIHPVINNRTKNRFQFAPELEVKGIQSIKIEYDPKEPVYPKVNVLVSTGTHSYKVLGAPSIEKLAINDGFESLDQFFAWFKKDFTGKIIHWTNLKY